MEDAMGQFSASGVKGSSLISGCVGVPDYCPFR